MAYESLTALQWSYVKEKVDALGYNTVVADSIFVNAVYDSEKPGKFVLYYWRSDGTQFALSVPIGSDKQWETDWSQFEDVVARAVEALRKSWV